LTVLCAATTKGSVGGGTEGAVYSPVEVIVPKPVNWPQFTGMGWITVVFVGGRQISQLTVEVEVPVTFTANGCVSPFGTDTGDAEVPVGVTVTPTGVELPPHPPTQAARIIAAPICQTLILNPPTIPVAIFSARPKITCLKLCQECRKPLANRPQIQGPA